MSQLEAQIASQKNQATVGQQALADCKQQLKSEVGKGAEQVKQLNAANAELKVQVCRCHVIPCITPFDLSVLIFKALCSRQLLTVSSSTQQKVAWLQK